MIARRLGRSVRLPQSLCPTSQVTRTANVASTSYTTQAPAQTRTFSSSLPVSISPTSNKLAKKRSNSKGSFVVQELAEEEDVEEDDDDEELFGSISTEEVTPTKDSTSNEPRLSFSEQVESIEKRLDQITIEKNAHLNVRKQEWKVLVQTASTLDELKKCLEVASYWNELAYLKASKLPKFTKSEGYAFVFACKRLQYPEFAFYALVNRADTGLEYNIDVLRIVQKNLVTKLNRLSPSKPGETISDEARTELLESQILDGAVKPKEEWKGVEEEDPKEVEILQAQLSLVDRTMALAALTTATSSDLTSVDTLTLLTSIRGMLQTFNLGKQSLKDNTFLESQVQPRITAAIEVLLQVYKNLKSETLERGQVYEVIEGCKSLTDYLKLNHMQSGGQIKLDEAIDALYKMMELAPPEAQARFLSQTERKFQ